MTSDSSNQNNPVFKTPNPTELKSEENRQEMRDRLPTSDEADLTNPDRISQGENTDSVIGDDDQSQDPINNQTGIISRPAG